MSFLRPLAPLLAFAASAATLRADVLTDFFPPDTNMALGMRVNNLALSPVARTWKDSVFAGVAEWMKLPQDRMDLFSDVDEVLLATNGHGKNAPVLIVVTGRFNPSAVKQPAGNYKGARLIAGNQASGDTIALIDASTALIGKLEQVEAAIDRRGNQQGIRPSLNDRITSLRQRYDVWGVGDLPDNFVAPVDELKILGLVSRFQFGVEVVNSLELTAELQARGMEYLGKVRMAVERTIAVLRGGGLAGGESKFEVSAIDDVVRIVGLIPEDRLETFSWTSLETATAEAAPTGPKDPPAPPRPAVDADQLVDKNGNAVTVTLPRKN